MVISNYLTSIQIEHLAVFSKELNEQGTSKPRLLRLLESSLRASLQWPDYYLNQLTERSCQIMCTVGPLIMQKHYPQLYLDFGKLKIVRLYSQPPYSK